MTDATVMVLNWTVNMTIPYQLLTVKLYSSPILMCSVTSYHCLQQIDACFCFLLYEKMQIFRTNIEGNVWTVNWPNENKKKTLHINVISRVLLLMVCRNIRCITLLHSVNVLQLHTNFTTSGFWSADDWCRSRRCYCVSWTWTASCAWKGLYQYHHGIWIFGVHNADQQ